MDTSQLAHPKGKTRTQLKGRRTRAEAKTLAEVRAEVFARDGGCRIRKSGPTVGIVVEGYGACAGELELAHLFRRSASRGMPPTVRHNTATAVCLCTKHHGMEERHELAWAYMTPLRADGYMRWIKVP